MNCQGDEKRTHPRRPCSTTIKFRLQDGAASKTYIGAATNISSTGMCVYTFDRLKEGSAIEIIKDATRSTRKGRIRWVKECCEDFFKIGIAFE